MTPWAPTELVERLRWQAEACERLGSPLYAHLMNAAADDLASGGIVARVLEGREEMPPDDMVQLRMMGALHRLVLEGKAPELAAHYPSAGGRAGIEGAWGAFRAALEAHAPEVIGLLDRPVQTNEVGRSAALVGGFLLVAERTSLPLRILEVGASAGLNLRWDHYLYEARGHKWGPQDSPVRLCEFDTSAVPPFDVRTEVADRRGCDTNPVDPTTREGRLALMSYVWADQVARFRLLRAALKVARDVPATVDRATAPEWLHEQLRAPHDGVATVVFHSIVWQYLTDEDRAGIESLLRDAGTAASPEAPLAWLRMEPPGDLAAIHLTTWPGGDEKLIAEAGYHGRPVLWRA